MLDAVIETRSKSVMRAPNEPRFPLVPVEMTIEKLDFQARSELSRRKQNLDLTPMRKVLKIIENGSNQQKDSDEDKSTVRLPYLVPNRNNSVGKYQHNHDLEQVLLPASQNPRSVSVIETRISESEDEIPPHPRPRTPQRRFMKRAHNEKLIRELIKLESETSEHKEPLPLPNTIIVPV
jgi:hypothetical protein